MSKKTLALIGGLILVVLVLFVVALNTRPQTSEQVTEQEETTEEQDVPEAEVVINLLPNPLEAATGTNEVEVAIDTGNNEVSAVQLELGYDPDVLTNVSVKQGTFFVGGAQLINQNDARTGRYSYAVGITPGQDAASGTGTVATVTFSVRPGASVTETTLELLPRTQVATPGLTNVSLLKEANGTTITVPVRSAPASNVTTAPTQ